MSRSQFCHLQESAHETLAQDTEATAVTLESGELASATFAPVANILLQSEMVSYERTSRHRSSYELFKNAVP